MVVLHVKRHNILLQCFSHLQTDKKGKDEPPPPPFAGMKLRKSKPVQRKQVEEPKIEKIELKHHEFEKLPQVEEVNIHLTLPFTTVMKSVTQLLHQFIRLKKQVG